MTPRLLNELEELRVTLEPREQDAAAKVAHLHHMLTMGVLGQGLGEFGLDFSVAGEPVSIELANEETEQALVEKVEALIGNIRTKLKHQTVTDIPRVEPRTQAAPSAQIPDTLRSLFARFRVGEVIFSKELLHVECLDLVKKTATFTTGSDSEQRNFLTRMIIGSPIGGLWHELYGPILATYINMPHVQPEAPVIKELAALIVDGLNDTRHDKDDFGTRILTLQGVILEFGPFYGQQGTQTRSQKDERILAFLEELIKVNFFEFASALRIKYEEVEKEVKETGKSPRDTLKRMKNYHFWKRENAYNLKKGNCVRFSHEDDYVETLYDTGDGVTVKT